MMLCRVFGAILGRTAPVVLFRDDELRITVVPQLPRLYTQLLRRGGTPLNNFRITYFVNRDDFTLFMVLATPQGTGHLPMTSDGTTITETIPATFKIVAPTLTGRYSVSFDAEWDGGKQRFARDFIVELNGARWVPSEQAD